MKKITAKEIAKLAGVSTTTVSFVLNNKKSSGVSQQTRENILRLAKENGYQISAEKVSRRPLSIGIMIPTLSNFYYPLLIQQIEIEARRRSISTIVMNTLRRSDDEQKYIDMLSQGIVDGILCLFSPMLNIPDNLPFVVVSEMLPGTNIDTISLNSYKAGYMMADHLIERGYREFVYISTPFPNITSARRYRMEGIHARLSESGLEKNLDVMTGNREQEIEDSAYEFDCGYTLTKELVSRTLKKNIAIIAVNDTTATGCLVALREQGVQVPDEVAVCGFDNLLIGRLCSPPLTTIDQMASHASKVGLDMLLEKIRQPSVRSYPLNVEYRPHLIIREST